jgi:hypothetical protein
VDKIATAPTIPVNPDKIKGMVDRKLIVVFAIVLTWYIGLNKERKRFVNSCKRNLMHHTVARSDMKLVSGSCSESLPIAPAKRMQPLTSIVIIILKNCKQKNKASLQAVQLSPFSTRK